jgi:glycine oxidase
VTTSPPILIIGAGVLGLCTAVMLSRRGHEVVVVDPGEPNASSVAAGMIAPAMEAAIDDLGPQAATLLRGGRDHWPAFAEATGVRLARRPANGVASLLKRSQNGCERSASRPAATMIG